MCDFVYFYCIHIIKLLHVKLVIIDLSYKLVIYTKVKETANLSHDALLDSCTSLISFILQSDVLIPDEK